MNLAAQLTAARHLGAYTLKWDVVQKSAALFCQQGKYTLNVSIDVVARPHSL